MSRTGTARVLGRHRSMLVVTGFLCSVAAGASAAPPDADSAITNYAATVRVADDGTLRIAEAVTYDFDGASTSDVERVVLTREHYDAEDDRIYDLTGVAVKAEETDVTTTVTSADRADTIAVHFSTPQEQQTTVRFDYEVGGAVAETSDGFEVRWPVVQGFDVPITDASVEWDVAGVSWLSCLAGASGSSKPCTTAQFVGIANPTMTQQGLSAGEEMVGILGLGVHSGVAPNADFEARWSLARGFTAMGTPLQVALGLLLLGLLGALALWWTRGRDSVAGDVETRVPLTDAGEGRLAFEPPSGVRPGQMGTLVDERADLVDVSATVVDLAVRNYLFIEELPHDGYGRRDWLLRRRNEAGDELLPYEREVFNAIFAADRRPVLVSDLGDRLRLRLPAIQALLYDDMVDQGWFGERPDAVRSRWTTAGWVLMAAGAVLTVVLASVSTFGLAGVAVLLAGAALAAAGQLAPSRTSRGGRVLGELRGFRAYLEAADVSRLGPSQREELISRFYPYAMVFGLGERWAAALAALDEDEDPDEPVYWYGAPSDWHLSDAESSLPQLAVALSAALANRRLLGV